MRIIGGALRGRRIQAPPGRGTRPMLDRVREAVFSTLAPWLSGACVLDLFAGSGSLGLEALSRGAARARLVERDARARELLLANVEALGLAELAEVAGGDALDPVSWSGAWDVVFLDPPYALLDPGREGGAARARVLGALAALVGGRLAAEGVLVLHVPRGAVSPADLPAGALCRERVYGTSSLWYVQAEGRAERGPA